MRRSLLATLISTLAFSFGSVDAAVGTGSGKSQAQNVIGATGYDVMGVTSNQIVCNKNAYNKREAYAAVHEAKMLEQDNKYAIAGCEKLVCTKYPANFVDPTLGFRVPGPYKAFPVLPNKKLYKGGRLPVRNLVIYNKIGDVAGIAQATFQGYSKCLLDDNYSPRPRGFIQGLRYQYRYWTGRK